MPLLFRADSGLCSHAIMQDISAQAQALAREIAIIIKWNPRSTPVESIAAERLADASTMWCHEREGKRMCLWSQELKLEGVGTQANPARRVLRLTQRTIVDLGFCHNHSNPLLLPAYELEGWTTTLPHKFTMHEVIALYKDHATHEQFHSEFKSDMDLERLPSGKFDTNFLVCALAAVAMNVLRLIGQNALIGDDAPLRHAAKRRRMKTVMQEIMFKAGRMIKHAGRWTLAGVSDVRCAEAPDRVHCLGRADQTDPYHIGADLKPPRTWQARGPPLWDDSDAQTDDGAQIAAHWNLAAQPAPDDEVDQRVNW